ncbi:MAG: dihydroorotate dehydrogenase electron transfer subunit [Bacteroidales bacterium]|nr:dihydroorotate dehydrogenase electron transfer subunit [Bacteroidales bacterium]
MKKIADFKVVSIHHICEELFEMEVQCKESLEHIEPGQFVNVMVPDTRQTFLRRPISICDVDEKNNTLRFYIRKVGNGTAKMSGMQPGDMLNIVYPLGKGFDTDSTNPLLIGGGCGIAPLVYLAKCFYAKGIKPTVLLGGKSAQFLTLKTYFKDIADIYLCTDDGTEGEKGTVIQHSVVNHVEGYDKIYTCGPQIMMKAVAKIATEKSIPCMVSLENTMACGVGACLCCVTKTREGHKCVCTEGPVFDVLELDGFIEK